MANGTLAPVLKPQFFTDDGEPAAGYQLFSYQAGTTTKQATYFNVGLTFENANPIILDASGRTAAIYLSATTYKFVLADPDDTDPPASPVWSQDNVGSVPLTSGDTDIEGTAGEDLAVEKLVYLSAGDGSLTAGRWYRTDADLVYGSTQANAIGFTVSSAAGGSTVTIRVGGRMTGLSGLTPGSLYYASATAGDITATAPTTNARPIGVADSATTLVLSPFTPGRPGRIHVNTTQVGNVGSGEDDLMSFSLPAGSLSSNGMSVKVLMYGTTASNSNAKTLKAYFGSTQVLGGSGASLTVSEAGNWLIGFVVTRTGAATQRAAAQCACGPAGSASTFSTTAATTPAETLSGAITIKATGEATSDNDIRQQGLIVELLY